MTVVANNLRIVGHLYTKLVPDEAFDLGFNSRSNLLNFSRLFTILCETNCTCFMQTVRHFVYCFKKFSRIFIQNFAHFLRISIILIVEIIFKLNLFKPFIRYIFQPPRSSKWYKWYLLIYI